jgi:phospholipase/carboxylesterase
MNSNESAGFSAAQTSATGQPELTELTTGDNPRYAVIWLHGLGADGYDFVPVVPMLGIDPATPTRFVFPHAPVRPVTINGGMAMRAWYDIRGVSIARDQDEAGIRDSAALVEGLIERELRRGIPASNIVLAGFSQGGAMAAYVGLRYPEKLAGLLVLSAYLLFPDSTADEVSDANRDTRVFVGHGNMDPVVPVSLGRELLAQLRNLEMPVEWHEYAMPHSVNEEEIQDIGAWLRAALAP